jgi:hypothetical protein
MSELVLNSIQEDVTQRRRAVRFACEGKAELFLESSGAVMMGELRDMSNLGCMMTTHARTPVDAGMRANLFFTVAGKMYRLACVVRSVRPGRCIGLEFQFESEMHRAEFNQLFYNISH